MVVFVVVGLIVMVAFLSTCDVVVIVVIVIVIVIVIVVVVVDDDADYDVGPVVITGLIRS